MFSMLRSPRLGHLSHAKVRFRPLSSARLLRANKGPALACIFVRYISDPLDATLDLQGAPSVGPSWWPMVLLLLLLDHPNHYAPARDYLLISP